MGYEQMGDRGPFCFLAAALSGQSHQRRQDHWKRSAADEQSGQYRFEDGGQQLTPKKDLSRSTVPPSEKQTGHSRGNQGHGCEAGTFRLPHAPLRNEIRGPRSGVLRGPTPPTTDQTSQVQSRQAWIPSHPSSGGLNAEVQEFLERIVTLVFV